MGAPTTYDYIVVGAGSTGCAVTADSIDNLWVADASIMPAVTSANTNAPSMMIGHRAVSFIAA
jgi:choline dehydrogenase